MKKFRVTITQEFELPDDCTVEEGAGSKLIKYGDTYLKPGIEFMQTNTYSKKEMRFTELDEEYYDLIFESLVLEKEDINEI